MSSKPAQPERARQVFADLQAAVGKIFANKLSPAVEFHTSSHFFVVYRPGRPPISLDVELETELPHIRFPQIL